MELLERQALLDTLAGSLAAAARGTGEMVVLTGEAGIGKTALAREFCARHAGDARVLWGACDALRTPRPMSPLHDMARATGGRLADLLASLPTGGAGRHAVFTAFLDLLTSGTPVIAVVEDVHWADEATLDLLLFLGRRVSATSALVVVTLRDEEVGEQGEQLQLVLGDLATARSVRRLAVPTLSRTAVATLSTALGVDPEQLYAVTTGNPFFVTEVLGSPGHAVPPTVRDAVLARAARLDPAARSALTAVAVVPDGAELSLLTDMGAERDALDACVQSGMLRTDRRRVWFRHELARVAIEQATPAVRRRVLHRTVLALLRARPDIGLVRRGLSGREREGMEAARLVHHAEEAGDADAVLEYAPAAAERASRLGAHREAAAQYATALRFADHCPAAVRAGLHELLAEEHHATGRAQAAIEESARALEHWREAGDREREAVLMSRRAHYLWTTGRSADARASVRDAVALLEELPPCAGLAAGYAHLAYMRMLARDLEGAAEAGRRAIDLAERFREPALLARALNAYGTAQWFTEPDKAAVALTRSLTVARECGDDVAAAAALCNLGSGAGEVRRYQLADRWLAESVSWSIERDMDVYRDYALAWLARTAFEQGRWAEAEEKAADVLSRPQRYILSRIVTLTVLGRVRARRGEQGVQVVLDEAAELAEQTGDLQRVWPVAAARAEAAWLAGRPEHVEDLVAGAFGLACRLRHGWAVGELGYWRWRAGAATGPPPGAAAPYDLEIRGNWRRAATTWEDLGCPYESATALAESVAPADLLAALATLNRLGARPVADRVAKRLRALGVRRLPRQPRRATAANPGSLTARELDVLALLPGGLRNVDIAARLHISPKTVDHHISAILAKLGVGSRREAADWMRARKS